MECLGVLLLLFLQGVLLSPSLSSHACPLACSCLHGSHVNCSSAGLSSTPLDLEKYTAILDLSHNVLTAVQHIGYEHGPLYQLTHLLLGHNRLVGLSLCLPLISDVTQEHLLHPLPCESWAPNLWLLSLEGNQLQAIPEGLVGSTFLEVLNLSYNKINAIQHGSLNDCAQLRELYLQHNNISSLHPLAFQHMVKLQVLDLSFNALGTIATTAYLSFRTLNTWLDVQGNLWRCDCDLRTLKKWMSFDHDWSQLSWKVVCEAPSQLAGRDLMHVDEAELTCVTVTSNAKYYQDVTVDLGADVLLPCSIEKWDTVVIYWWTPHGVVESTDSQGGLLLHNIGMHDEGLYACTSGENQRLASVFDIQVRNGSLGVRRITRDVQSQKQAEERSHSQFVLAVCLSVFITFIGAFILGALARPLLNVLWRRMCARKTLTESPNPCENMGYSVEDEEDDQERRVSRDHRASEPYYITVLPNPDGASPKPECSAEATVTLKNGEVSIDARSTYENISVVRKGNPPELNQEPCSEGDDKSDNSMTEITITDDAYSLDAEVNLNPVNMTEPDQENHLNNNYFKGELEVDWSENIYEQEEDQIKEDDMGKSNTTWNPCPAQSPSPSPESFTACAVSVTPNLLDPNLDPDFWNDSGESFEFSDSGKDLSQFNLAIKTDPGTMLRDLTMDHPQESQGLHGPQDENSNHVLSYKDSVNKHTCESTDSVVKLEQVSPSSESLQSHHHHDNGNEPTDHTLCQEHTDEVKGQMNSDELSDEPADHTQSYELRDEPTGYTQSFEHNETTGHTLTNELKDEPTEYAKSYELNDEPTEHALTCMINDEPTGHALTYELRYEPTGHTLTCELNDGHTGYAQGYELNDDTTVHIQRYEINDEHTGYAQSYKLDDEPTGYAQSYKLDDEPTGYAQSYKLDDEPTGYAQSYKLDDEPTGYAQSYELDGEPTGYAQSYELNDEHIKHTPTGELRNELMGHSPDLKVFCKDTFCLHPKDGTDPVVQFASKSCDNLKSPDQSSCSSNDTRDESTVLRELNRMNSKDEPELDKTSFAHNSTIQKHPDTYSDIPVTSTFEDMPSISLEKHMDYHNNCSPGGLGSEWPKPGRRWSERSPEEAPWDSAADSGKVTSAGEPRENPVVYHSEEPQPKVWTDVTPPSPTAADSGDWRQNPWEASQLQTTRRPFLFTASPYTPNMGWNSVLPRKPRRSSDLSQKSIDKDTLNEEAVGEMFPSLVQEESLQGIRKQDWRAGGLFLQGWRTTDTTAPSTKCSDGIMGEDLTSSHTSSWRHRPTAMGDMQRDVKTADEPYRGPHLSDTQKHGEDQGNLDFSFSRSGAQSSQLFDIDNNQGSEA
ncbi:uncharacterized protein LOC125738972 isoform X2 [Brienomyrus brachyistius]|uniref:uncharacterized protein LOC125738972 isoform X2 n=1 Tax=Brienomyrus brachyistius TaxID=42636 RepID=UPI0020B36EC4|nr:uncharacterized protein LOC125738972 isoform X2 [Brienomyrus brachyistius]